ncbi:NADH-quinone oxidoreductase subunit NuoG [Marinimicrobium agarilyticum]|uniref:NADH-quinone oxidoreductase subunit NuoG n=1 Tax=Marinimicrobium agarilyticum TaxID=306546 RepID=UPI000416ACE7|nr:NADH-quinone oxidoreductase subunit NuoG [Marinimicrobium agarilyticum]
MATIYVDGEQYQVNGSHNLLQACLEMGLEIPYFCWHPAMGSVGACRQCAVKQYKDEDDDKGMLVMSCMSPAKDGTRISIADDEAEEFRQSVIEWMMISHPHDCPVCEEGGHCHLQDMTVMTGHDRRRYRFNKRTHRNQDLGPFIGHEMNRCITCYRCVRFYRDYAGGDDLGAFGANDNIYFGRYQDGTLESEFSGNLTEVCPTGVFTDRTHSERYTRKWDMQFGPSVCHQCSVGCNISAGERYGDVRRIENRYHGEVNRYFLCDRGRFGYGYVNRDDRPLRPEGSDGGGTRRELDVDEALDRAGELLRHANGIVGIGSPRASLESNHQLKQLVGDDNFSTGLVGNEQACVERMRSLNESGGLPTPSLRDIERHDAVLVLGEDPIQSAARLGLSIRQAVLGRREELAEERGIPLWNAEAIKTLAQDKRYPLFTAYPQATGLDGIAEQHWNLAPADIARLGFAVAHEIDPNAPAVTELDVSTRESAKLIAEKLLAADRPLLVSGGSLGSVAIIEACGNIARALAKCGKQDAGLSLIRREANSTGVEMLGGQPLEWALDRVIAGEADTLVIVENDLYQRLATETLDAVFAKAPKLIVLDHQRTATLERADLALSSASFAEADGTLVSMEGRGQRFFQVYEPRHMRPETRLHESWRWLHALAAERDSEPVSDITLDAVVRDCAERNATLEGIVDAAPDADFRISGQKLARSPHRYSGRTAMRAHLDVSEPAPTRDPDSALAFSMEGYSGFDRPRPVVPFAWAPGFNSPEAWNKFMDEIGGHLRAGDPGVRLFELANETSNYSAAIPDAFVRGDDWQLTVLPRLFGGEETSSRAAPIIERSAPAHIAVARADAERLGLGNGHWLSLTGQFQALTLPATIDDHLPEGMVSVPAGVDPALINGARVSLSRIQLDEEVSS